MTTSLNDTPLNEMLEEVQPTIMYDYSGPFSDSINVAHHYGFHLVKPLEAEATNHEDEDFFHDTYKIACAVRGKDLTKNGPDLVCHTQNPRRKQGSLMLEAHGCPDSIADGIVLKTGLSILRNAGEQHLAVEINSLGDSEAQQRFKKHFSEFVKRHLNKIPPEYQNEVRTNPFFASKLSAHDNDLANTFADAPIPLNYLSEHDRRHLSEVIEYLESIGIAYRLNPHLLGSDTNPSHTFFRIIRTEPESRKKKEVLQPSSEPHTLAWGERFDYRESKSSPKQSIVSLSIKLPGGKHETYREKKAEEQPKLYFVHIGPEAKRIGFKVLDVLRETQIPVKQYLIRNSLSDQMSSAEAAKPSHILIMGMKEAQENSVIVRNTETRAQTIVEIPRLKTYLKNSIKF